MQEAHTDGGPHLGASLGTHKPCCWAPTGYEVQ